MSRKVKLGWKVVKLSYNQPKKDKYFISSHVGELEYKFDRWTWPKDGCGPLCVFTTRKAARNFVSWERLRVIRKSLGFRCQADKTTKIRRFQ